MSLTEYILLAASSLFVIVDPLATVPAFLAMTPTDTPEQRMRMARLACCVAAGCAAGLCRGGQVDLQVPRHHHAGVSARGQHRAAVGGAGHAAGAAFAGSGNLRGNRGGAEKTDIAVTPLAIPMLAGPGAISTAILLHNQAASVGQRAALYLCILGVCLATYLIFRISARGARWLSPIAMSITARIMGLLLAAVAIQFMLNAIRQLNPSWFPAPA